MPLTVLSDADARQLLLGLTRDDILDLQTTLRESLHEYSTGAHDAGCSSANQPTRSVITKHGQRTIFMPASSGDLYGMKITSVPEWMVPKRKSENDGPIEATSKDLQDVSLDDHKESRPNRSLTLLDSAGEPTAFINANELTAFRTALASTLLFTRRSHVSTITVFGAGKQAFWHIRLALLLRGPEIKHVNIINRSFDPLKDLLTSFYSPDNSSWRSSAKFSTITPGFVEYDRLLKDYVRKADAIFCCTPSLDPLFPAEYLTSSEGRRKGRYIAAIGSFKRGMCELHPDVFRSAVESSSRHDGQHIHWHKHAPSAGVVVVDSLETCLQDAGELIEAGLTSDQLVEVGELIIVKRAAMKEREEAGHAPVEGELSQAVQDQSVKGLQQWLEKGNVVYKSVGFGLLDLVVGGSVVQLARDRGLGTTIDSF